MKLASKTAIVTGAARGIGFGIAQVLAREGARVIIADRDAHGEAAAASCANRAHRRCLSAAISLKNAGRSPVFPGRRGVWPGRHSGE